jgi:predicted GNAT family N-acyltransferase
MTVVVRRIAGGADDPLLLACFALRHEVFVTEQGVPADLELDADDRAATTHHLALIAPDDHLGSDLPVVGTVRWIVEPAGYAGLDPARGPVVHLQRLAVAAPYRGTGLGARLVREVEQDAQAGGFGAVALGGQLQALPFYERLGYRAHGPVFDDAGIPHRLMVRTTAPA